MGNALGHNMASAAEEGDIDALKALIEANGDPNTLGSETSALAMAVSNGHVEAVRLLLEAGADVNLADSIGVTALHSIETIGDNGDDAEGENAEGDDDPKKSAGEKKKRKKKKKKGAANEEEGGDDTKDKNLAKAIEIATLLGDAGADIWATNTFGETAMGSVVTMGPEVTMAVLGWTPLAEGDADGAIVAGKGGNDRDGVVDGKDGEAGDDGKGDDKRTDARSDADTSAADKALVSAWCRLALGSDVAFDAGVDQISFAADGKVTVPASLLSVDAAHASLEGGLFPGSTADASRIAAACVIAAITESKARAEETRQGRLRVRASFAAAAMSRGWLDSLAELHAPKRGGKDAEGRSGGGEAEKKGKRKSKAGKKKGKGGKADVEEARSVSYRHPKLGSLLHLLVAPKLGPVLVEALRRGADPNVIDADKMTPLHLAAKAGLAGEVRILLDHCAEVNARDFFGQTALHYAVHLKSAEVVEVLCRYGADPDCLNRSGQTPRAMAPKSGSIASVFASIPKNESDDDEAQAGSGDSDDSSSGSEYYSE